MDYVKKNEDILHRWEQEYIKRGHNVSFTVTNIRAKVIILHQKAQFFFHLFIRMLVYLNFFSNFARVRV
jgi:hypothetical protein